MLDNFLFEHRTGQMGVVFFTLTSWASMIPSNLRGCESGTWSSGQENVQRNIYKYSNVSSKKQNKNKNKIKQNKTKQNRNDEK